MSTFFNNYTKTRGVHFNSIVAQDNEALSYIVGQIAAEGLFSLFSEEGNTIWTKRYRLPEGECNFLNAVEAGNGDFLILGTESIRNADTAIVVRVNSTGHLIWAKRYTHDESSTAFLRLIQIGDPDTDEYVFGTRMKGKGRTEDFSLIKIDGSGNVTAAKDVVPDSDEKAFGIVRTLSGIVVFGGMTEKKDWDNFFIQFDNSLNLVWAKLVGDKDSQVARDVIYIDDKEFIVTGEHGRKQDSFIYRMDPNLSSVSVNILDLTKGKDSGFKKLGHIKGATGVADEFLLLSQSSKNDPSTFTRFDNALAPLWHKEVDVDSKHEFNDLWIHDDGDERVRACGDVGAKLDGGLLMRTTDQLEICVATDLPNLTPTPVQYKISTWEPPIEDVQIKVDEIPLIENQDETEKGEICPSAVIDLSGETLVQSPYVYLQAAGSDNSDDTPTGYHLRWDFRKVLSDKHIAKGSLAGDYGLYPATYDFNKNDDFIKVYRTEFVENYYTDLDFTTQPTTFDVSGAIREWQYSNLLPTGVTGGIPANAIVSFPDTAAYDTLAGTTNPATSVLDFLKLYTGEINIRLEDKFSFRVEWGLGLVDPAAIATAQLRYETISLSDSLDDTSKSLLERTVLTQPDFAGTPLTICEDIESIRFDRTNAFTQSIRFYAYIDYLQGTNEQKAWEKLNDYALTLNQTKAYKRLEDSPTFQIDGLWPKFNESNNTTQAFKVNVPNYQNRWSDSEGLNYGVEQYLNLSQVSTNYTATEIVAADPIGNLPDNSTMEISYFDLLQIAGIDYHMGRMLGLGHIDAKSNAQSEDRYIYLMEYDTLGDIEDGGGARPLKHLYMTPHLTILDFKNPPVPVLQDPPSYGLAVDNGTANPSLLTDDQGYTAFADIRFVNIHRQLFQYENDFETFFENVDPFTICTEAEPVAFGMEYALQGEPWIKPELNHDRVYNDGSNLPETLMIPNAGTNPVYRHQETEEGIHCYAMYSINWFSRPSVESTPVCTNYTEFPKRNTIIPPMNLAVQLVQSEAPPILTTSQEQTFYGNMTGDKSYLRVSFDWNYIHNQAHQFAHKAQFFFNKQEKQILKGEITGIVQLTENRVQVTTTSFDILSTSPITTVQPNIAPGREDHFTESLFAVDGLNYRVEQVLDTTATLGDDPTFILHKIRETNSVETPTGSNVWLTTETYVEPVVGGRFLVAENMGNAKNWDNKLAKSVYLESFSTNDSIKVDGSTNNDGKYTILSVDFVGAQTEITVLEAVDDTITDGNIEYDKIDHIHSFNTTNNGFLIEGDVSADFAGVTTLRLFASLDNDGDYTIVSAAYNGVDTDVVVTESIFLNSAPSCIAVKKQVTVQAYNTANDLIILNGDYTAEIIPTYKEDRPNLDGTTTELVMGGFIGECTIAEEPDVYDPSNVVGAAVPGDPIPGSLTGVYTFTFAGNPLPAHIDPDVAWFRGKVRVLEDDNYLPTPLDTRTDAKMKELDVWNVYEDSGNLILVVKDPAFQVDPSTLPTTYTPSGEYVPILIGSNIEINYHPSYMLYLTVDETPIETGIVSNEFNEDSILPDFEEGSRRTFLGIRAVDGINNDPTVDDCASHVATPAAIVAQEIRDPEAPLPPAGPLYATRPDFYGKATYSMDIGFTNIPYSVLVYKANERKILDTLYLPLTVETILMGLAAIPQPDAYFTQRWSDLVNVVLETSGPNIGEFKEYPGSSFRFDIPDNPDYILPESFTANTQINPFNGTDAPGSATSFNIPELSLTVSMVDAVKDAITGAFVSQTENPMLFQHIKNGDRTSNAPPRLRDDNGDLIAPSENHPDYEPFPFAVKLTSGELRFCDYNIDGGSVSHYFYYAMELSDRQIKSDPSGIVGPIQLVNTRPAKPPSVKKIVSQVENQIAEIPTAVCFELEEFIESEKIERIDVYRATDPIDALTVRTMDAAAEIEISGSIADTELCDLFTGLSFPLYGEDLHYRLIAMRKITLEDGVSEEYIPSEPSKLVKTTLVDPNNPLAPCMTSENGTTTPTELQNVILKWEQACYNGTYSLQKMSTAGNWETIYTIKSNDAEMQYPPIVGGSPDFTNFDATVSLPREDASGNTVYNRFRVQVENSSGLFNLTDCPMTLATGCADLNPLSSFVTYSDSNGFSTSDFATQDVNDDINNNPGQVTFTANIPSVLPAGHSSFSQLDISISDDLGNTASGTIGTPAGTLVFNDGDGDTGGDSLQLNDPNRTYKISLRLFTDFCTSGSRFSYALAYTYDPCDFLREQTDVVNFADANALTVTPLESAPFNDGTNDNPGGSMTIGETISANLPAGDTFTKVDVTINDELGGTFTDSILTTGGDVTISNGQGGLVMDATQPNLAYTFKLVVFTTLCPDGVSFVYSGKYTFGV